MTELEPNPLANPPAAQSPSEVPEKPVAPEATTRRTLLIASLGAVGALAVGGWTLRERGRNQAMRSITLPGASKTIPVPQQPMQVPGTSSYVVPTNEFFQIDIATWGHRVDPKDWELKIGGAVQNALTLSHEDLLVRDLIEFPATLSCVSNEVGGGLVGHAVWRGILLKDLAEEVGASIEGHELVAKGHDGFTAVFDAALAVDERQALLALGMNGEILTDKHGFPARLVVPGLYGFVSATKWLKSIEFLPKGEAQGYWTDKGWSAQGPIKLSSRIENLSNGSTAAAGGVTVAGHAWSQYAITGVQVAVDDGPWQDATVDAAAAEGAWVGWRYDWLAEAGEHVLKVRASDSSGEVQTAEVADIAPDGATGHHAVRVKVE